MARPPPGRPPKEIKWEAVKKRIQAGNTAKVIAKELDINVNTFYTKFKDEFGESFQDYREGWDEMRDSNLAYTQYVKALSGNAQLLIRLGEIYLGQGSELVEKNSLQDQLTDMRSQIMELSYKSNKKDEIIKNLEKKLNEYERNKEI